jgi:hypothetical protein
MTHILRRLEQLRAQHGIRFEPAGLIRERARTGRGFYGD